MIRDLPKGQFGAYLRAHYLRTKPIFLPRFSMGCGVIFMIQRVKPLETTLLSRGSIAETDPSLLEEMVSLIASLKLDVVSLAEMRRRLTERDLERRFACFTFDGAYRSVIDTIFPLFQKRGLPFTVYAATDYLDDRTLPWWLSLEVLLNECDKVSFEIEGEKQDLRCWSLAEKQRAYGRLFPYLRKQDRRTRIGLIEAAMKKRGVDIGAAAAREMVSGEELRRLAESGVVTVGTQAGGGLPLGELSYDQAKENIEQSVEKLEAAIGRRPCDLAFTGDRSSNVAARDVKIVSSLEFATAVTSLEGALWPEHAHELLALPRVALDNDPATLVRALMLSGQSITPDHAAMQAGAL